MVQPRLHSTLQVSLAPPLGGLHIKHRGKVTLLQSDGTDEEIGLPMRISTGNKVMVSTANETMSASRVEIGTESLIAMIASLGSLKKDETQGELSSALLGQE